MGLHSQASTCPWSPVGKVIPFLGTKSFSWISRGRTLFVGSLFQPLFAQGRHIFWAQSSLDFGRTPIDGTSTSMGSTTSMLHTGGKSGIAPVEMCTIAWYPCEVTISSHASLCTWMLSSGQSSWFLFVFSTAKMPSMWEVLSGISSFSSLSASDAGNSKLEESTWSMCSTGLLMHDLIIDFNMYKLWLCRYLRMIEEEFFWFFVLPFFQNKHKIKTKSGFKRLFNDGECLKRKALHKFTFVSGGTKGFFF